MAPQHHPTPCEICGEILMLTRQANAYCQTNECITEFARRRAWDPANFDKVGDCDVWKLSIQHKGSTPIVTLRFNNQRRDFRVLALRDSQPERATFRVYVNTCGTPRCVTLEHHYVRYRGPGDPTMRILARLPVEPVDEYVRRNKIVIGAMKHKPLQSARKKGWFTVTGADAFCIDVLGIHPAQIYGDLFFTAGLEEADAA